MSLGVGSDNAGGIVSQRRVLRATGDDAVGSSDAERFRDDAEVVDSMERDLCRLRPSAGGRRGGWVGVEEFVEVCMVKRAVKDDFLACKRFITPPRANPYFSHDTFLQFIANSSNRPSPMGV
jgi:hypothetical protein